MNEYQLQILDHYKNPRNWGAPANPKDYKHGSAKNTSCGDELEVFLKVNNDVIEQVFFNGRGCSISIASASIIGEQLAGKKISELKNFNEKSVLTELGIELTASRTKCATLVLETLRNLD